MTSGGGKVALVTGGARRIGAAVSRALGKAGYEVLLTNRSSRREAVAATRETGGTALPLDLSRPASFRRFAGRIRESRGRLDLLAHNAAVFHRTPVDTLSAAEWDGGGSAPRGAWRAPSCGSRRAGIIILEHFTPGSHP